MISKSIRIACAIAVAATVFACNFDRSRPAHGRPNSIIVAVADSVWADVGDSVQAALEPRIFTVRDEKTFEVTQVSPVTRDFGQLRRFRQVLAIGTTDDPWIQQALGGRPPTELPAIVEQQNVWARNQLVTAVVLPPGGGAAEVLAVLPRIADQLDFRFREYAQTRMFVSGADEALRDSLARMAGFSLLLPEVYRYQRLDSAYVFRNHSEMSGVLQRAILVTWRSGVAPTLGVSQALAWRDSIGAVAYDPGQDVDRERLETRAYDLESGPALEVQGVWRGEDPTWPTGGPFITRMITCTQQNRTYLLDAWLFAPGRAKYEYMIQLNTILDSFHCGQDAQAPARAAAS